MARPSVPLSSPSPRRWAVLGAGVGLLLACVLFAPARWLSGAVAQATQGRVQLQQARGTVWSGDAALTLSADTASHEARRLPGRLHWQWGLAWPGLSLHLSNPCCTTTPLHWQLLWHDRQWRLQLDDQTSHWPLALLAGLGAPWNTLQAEGRLEWQSSGLQLSWREGQVFWHGENRLGLNDLSSVLTTARPMGSYQLNLQGTEAGTTTPALALTTAEGPLRLSGQGQWTGERLRFEGEASADPGSEPALNNLLNIIGRREGPRSRLTLG